MLTKCRNAKCGSRAFKRTFCHEIWMKIRWRMKIWKFLNFHEFAWILHVFVRKFSIFAKMQKCSHIDFYIFPWVLVQNACKVARWKSLDPDFTFLHFLSICEHPASIYGHIYDTKKNAIFHYIFALVIRKWSCLLGKCSWMLTRCKNAKYDARAIQRTSYQINWTKTRWERSIWSQKKTAKKTAFYVLRPNITFLPSML